MFCLDRRPHPAFSTTLPVTALSDRQYDLLMRLQGGRSLALVAERHDVLDPAEARWMQSVGFLPSDAELAAEAFHCPQCDDQGCFYCDASAQ